MSGGNLLMIAIGAVFILLAIRKDYEPLLLLPIGFGCIVGNLPSISSMAIGVYDKGSVLYYIYFGVSQGIFPPLIFLGIGAMTDFLDHALQPPAGAAGSSGADGHFPDLDRRALPRLHSYRGRGHRHYRRGRRADGDLPRGQAGSSPARGNRHRCVLLHGFGTSNSTAGDETVDHSPRAADSHEAPARGLAARKDYLSHRRLPHLRAPRPGRDRA